MQLAQEMNSRRVTKTSFTLTDFATSLSIKKKVSLFGAVERNNKFNKCYLHTAVKKEGGFLKLCVNKESTLSLFKCS